MSGEAPVRRRQPVVVATDRALAEARRLLPGAQLENLVTSKILAGRVRRDSRIRDGWAVELTDGVWAAAYRRPSPLGTRRSWVVERVVRP